MPGHVKSSMFGVSLNIPITKGKLNLGTWQVSNSHQAHRWVPSSRFIECVCILLLNHWQRR